LFALELGYIDCVEEIFGCNIEVVETQII
jgi:hypothetical protein